MFASDDDREVIQDFCRRAAVSAVADLIRAEGSQLVLRSAPPAEIEVTPVLEATDDRSWWERLDKVSLTLRTVGVLAALGLCGAVVWLVVAIAQGIATTVTTAVPVLLTVAGVVAVVVLICSLGGGSGGGFSGTFQGRMR